MLTRLLLLIAGLVALWLCSRLYKARTRCLDLPQPPRSWLFGHLKLIAEVAATLPTNTHPQHFLTAIAHEYNLKDLFYLDLWPISEPQVVLIDPVLQDEITVNRSPIQHEMSKNFIDTVLGEGVIAVVNGPVWKKLHNIMAPAFSWSHIRNMTGVIQEETLRFRSTLEQFAKSGESFSFEDEAAKLIFDVISRVVFNFSMGAQQHGSQTLDDLKQLMKLAESQMGFNPFLKTRAAFKRRAIHKRLDAEIISKIDQRLALLKKEKLVPSRKEPLSILDLMLRETMLDTANDYSLSRQERDLLVTNIKALLFFGHGTTTDSFCYLMMLLSTNSDVVHKMRAEHTEQFGDSLTSRIETLLEQPEKVERLQYTTAVIKESLRLFPIGFGLKSGHERQTITHEGQTHLIDGNLALVSLLFGTHYDARYFPAATKFNPNRFMDADAPVPRHYWRPFSRGPRACIAQNFAMNELRVILLLITHDFDFQCANLVPNPKPRAVYTDLDTIYGDIVFQEMGVEAKPRGGMTMIVSKV